MVRVSESKYAIFSSIQVPFAHQTTDPLWVSKLDFKTPPLGALSLGCETDDT